MATGTVLGSPGPRAASPIPGGGGPRGPPGLCHARAGLRWGAPPQSRLPGPFLAGRLPLVPAARGLGRAAGPSPVPGTWAQLGAPALRASASPPSHSSWPKIRVSLLKSRELRETKERKKSSSGLNPGVVQARVSGGNSLQQPKG